MDRSQPAINRRVEMLKEQLRTPVFYLVDGHAITIAEARGQIYALDGCVRACVQAELFAPGLLVEIMVTAAR